MLSTISSLGEVKRKMLISSVLSGGRTQGNSLKLHQGKFRLYIKKKLFTEKVVKPWNNLLKEVIMAPSLWVFKKCLDNLLRYKVQFSGCPVSCQDLTFHEGPLQLRVLFGSMNL